MTCCLAGEGLALGLFWGDINVFFTGWVNLEPSTHLQTCRPRKIPPRFLGLQSTPALFFPGDQLSAHPSLTQPRSDPTGSPPKGALGKC